MLISVSSHKAQDRALNLRRYSFKLCLMRQWGISRKSIGLGVRQTLGSINFYTFLLSDHESHFNPLSLSFFFFKIEMLLSTDNSLQYSCLGNPMDRGAWWATVPGVTKELDMTL